MKALRCLLMFFPMAVMPVQGTVSWTAPPEEQTQGNFWATHWYNRGIEHGNPAYASRFRVNAPESSITGWVSRREEARENGMMLIKAERDLLTVTGAELYLELWGGHPGTANKRVTVNGRSTYQLPEVGTADGHCTYSYPVISLKKSDLVNGYNAFQFAVDQGSSFWGHTIIDNACLRLALTNGHPELQRTGLERFTSRVLTSWNSAAEAFALRVEFPPGYAEDIENVTFQGWYCGYDENGDGRKEDWHGFTKNRSATAMLGQLKAPQEAVVWDVSMLPAQTNVAVRALIQFKQPQGVVYLTAATAGLRIPDRTGIQVSEVTAADLPKPFWSRSGKARKASVVIPFEPGELESAELHVVAWAGGAGSISDYFRLNGQPYPIAEGSAHDLVYTRMQVSPASLKQGDNTIELISDTEHHGIEICLPGPALVLRHKLQK